LPPIGPLERSADMLPIPSRPPVPLNRIALIAILGMPTPAAPCCRSTARAVPVICTRDCRCSRVSVTGCHRPGRRGPGGTLSIAYRRAHSRVNGPNAQI
jgi:hypothetical protein